MTSFSFLESNSSRTREGESEGWVGGGGRGIYKNVKSGRGYKGPPVSLHKDNEKIRLV